MAIILDLLVFEMLFIAFQMLLLRLVSYPLSFFRLHPSKNNSNKNSPPNDLFLLQCFPLLIKKHQSHKASTKPQPPNQTKPKKKQPPKKKKKLHPKPNLLPFTPFPSKATDFDHPLTGLGRGTRGAFPKPG